MIGSPFSLRDHGAKDIDRAGVQIDRIKGEAEDFAASDPTGELRKKEEELRKSVESQKH